MTEFEDINEPFERMTGMGIEYEENSELVFDEEADDVSNKFEMCLVG